MALTEDDLTQEIFEEYGMSSLPPIEAFKLLDSEEPEILIFCYEDVQPVFETSFYSAEVYYCISPNNVDWYIYRGNTWISTTLSEFLRLEWTAEEMALIPQEEFESFFPDDQIYLKTCAISNVDNIEPSITEVYATSIQSYFVGQDYIYSGDDMTIDTSLWVKISHCYVSMMSYPGAKIRFALQSNTLQWMICKNDIWSSIPIGDVIEKGMTAEELMAISSNAWEVFLSDKLKLCVGIYSPDKSQTPKVYGVTFDYVAYDNPQASNQIEIITPKLIYNRNILSNTKFIYEEWPVEGIGFDDPEELYNFYTTPNKIVLRVLNMGTLIGTKTSEIFKAVIVNTWETRDYDVSLTMKNDNGIAIKKASYCLVKDAEEEKFMTVGELSLQPPEKFLAEYPLNLQLKAQERKIFYFRLTPNATTIGKVECKIVASAKEI